MARLTITTSANAGGIFSAGGGGVTTDIKLDETAFGADEFNTVLGGLTVSATTILAAMSGGDDEPEARPVVVVRVPADQVEAVSALNRVPSEDFPNGGLLIVPANWDEAPLPDDRPTFPMEDAAGPDAGCA